MLFLSFCCNHRHCGRLQIAIAACFSAGSSSMRTFGAPCGLRALSIMFAVNSPFILLPPSTLRPPLLALGAPGRPAPGPISPAVPHGICMYMNALRRRMAATFPRARGFVGDFRAAEALSLPSERALAWILTASRQRRLIYALRK